MTRPNICVVVPFAGDPQELREVAARLVRLERTTNDDLVIVDNNRPPCVLSDIPRQLRVVEANREGSSYYARNVGARCTKCDWLLFIDADCDPAANILDAYFSLDVSGDVGAVAGGIEAAPGESIVERYAAARKHLDAEAAMRQPSGAYGATANLLVRREALKDLGGFREGIKSAGDQDFCWRLTQAGWTLNLNVLAVVQHSHRVDLQGLQAQMKRYGAGAAWLRRQHGSPSPVWSGLLRMAKGTACMLVALMRMDLEAVRFAGLDIVSAASYIAGSFTSNGSYWSQHSPNMD